MTRLPRRRLLLLTVAAAALPLSRIAVAQSYPNRYVRIVVPFPPGGSTDPVARVLAGRLSEVWGQQVVIENKGGGAHVIGAQQVANATPDGHTMMFAEAGTYVVNPNLYPKDKMPIDIEKDFIVVTGLIRIHHSVMVSPKLPVNSVAELIALAKQKPGEISYGTAGIGSGPHVNVVRFENAANVDFWVCDVTALPFPSGTFAAAVSLNVLDCVPSPLDMLGSLARVLTATSIFALNPS